MTPEDHGRKMLNDAIDAYKGRARDAVMQLPALPENDEKRRTLVMQFQIADDVQKSIAAAIKR